MSTPSTLDRQNPASNPELGIVRVLYPVDRCGHQDLCNIVPITMQLRIRT